MSEDLELFVPGFRFDASEWELLISDARQHAARVCADLQGGEEGKLDERDYILLFEDFGDEAVQRSAIACSYCEMYGIRVALALGFPPELRFLRYDAEADRIVATLPLASVRRILELRKAMRGGIPDEMVERLIGPVTGELGSEEIAQALGRLNRRCLSYLLSDFLVVDPATPRHMRIYQARARAAFAESIDWDQLRSAVHAMSRERSRLASQRSFLAIVPPLLRG